ncbi:MAG: hemerythrin domain-containing protein [Halieaceae bacterium]
MAAAQPEAYSRKNWETVARSLRGDQISSHPVLATLYAEHRYMATLIKLLEGQLELLEQGEAVDSQVLYESLHYLTHYPDAFHHPREDLVYQRAGELDGKLADSVDTLQREHDYLAEVGTKALQAVASWQEAEIDAADVNAPIQEYIESMYRHMNAEEKLVFPEIERVLGPDDWRELEQEDLLTPSSDPVFGPKVSREYRNLARKARRALRRGAEDAALVEWIGLEALLEGVEVLSIAGDNGRAAAHDHFVAAREEARDLIRDATEEGSILTLPLLPLRCTLVGGGHYVGFLRELGSIAKEVGSDLSELRKGARERVQLALD